MVAVATWNDVDDAILSAERTFTETAGSGVYTAAVTIPAGATLVDIQVNGIAVWDNAGNATGKVGDASDDDGWYTGINMKATDLAAGEIIRFSSSGGKEGVYLVQATGLLSAAYSASARVISMVVTTTSTGGTAGRTRLVVLYANPASNSSAAVKA
jgi:hypothetical protein